MSDNKRPTGKIEIELTEDIAQGTYANLAIISHSPSEFILDFAALLPGVTKAKVRSRVILSPEHAKRLLYSLQDNIARYESKLGEITITQSAPSEDDSYSFGSKPGEA